MYHYFLILHAGQKLKTCYVFINIKQYNTVSTAGKYALEKYAHEWVYA